MAPAENPLAEIARVAEMQVDIVLDCLARSGCNRTMVERNGFEMLLKAIRAKVDQALKEGSPSGTERAQLSAFAEKMAQLDRIGVDVRDHLIRLSKGWRCGACGSNVAAAAWLSGLRAGAVQVDLACRACQKRTRLGPDQSAVFSELFGHLVTPTWDPSANGFQWDGT